jgi:hypothetical protein
MSLSRGPGSSLNFAPYKEKVEETAQWDVPYKSPSCSMVALGDKTVSFCNPGEPNCPMSRPLLPERLFDPGMWTYYSKKTIASPVGGEINIVLIVLVAVAVLILLSFAQR